jgi:hypothetical protein
VRYLDELNINNIIRNYSILIKFEMGCIPFCFTSMLPLVQGSADFPQGSPFNVAPSARVSGQASQRQNHQRTTSAPPTTEKPTGKPLLTIEKNPDFQPRMCSVALQSRPQTQANSWCDPN